MEEFVEVRSLTEAPLLVLLCLSVHAQEALRRLVSDSPAPTELLQSYSYDQGGRFAGEAEPAVDE